MRVVDMLRTKHYAASPFFEWAYKNIKYDEILGSFQSNLIVDFLFITWFLNDVYRSKSIRNSVTSCRLFSHTEVSEIIILILIFRQLLKHILVKKGETSSETILVSK